MSTGRLSSGAPAAITLRPFTTADRFRLNRWLGEAHVTAWFGSRAIASAEIAMAQASASALVRIVDAGATAIGYLHAYDCALLGGARPDGLDDGAWLVTAFIGDVGCRGRGLGAAAIADARDELFATTLAPAVLTLVPVANEPAVRALERHAFRWRAIWRDAALGPCWVLASERP